MVDYPEGDVADLYTISTLLTDVARRSWLAIAARALGREAALSVDVLKDEDSGDLILRLAQHE